jgi:SAM-dependent methyltransferase
MRIVEIGGGAGSSTAALVRSGAIVSVVDISAPFFSIGKTRLSAMGLAARQILAPVTWLRHDESVEAIFHEVGDVDIVVCYALFEHLTIGERLRLLKQIRKTMMSNRKVRLAIWETPNRLSPFDWHTTRAVFPDVVPDELAALYLKTAIPRDSRWAGGGPWDRGEAGKADWARAGRGMSFHEFAVAFGTGNYKIIQDGYWGARDQQSFYKPNLAYERALEEIFANMTPPVHRGFCRPSLNLVVELA